MTGDLEALLFETDRRSNVWRCAIHGTVSKCPFAYMNCDAHDAPNLKQIFGAAMLRLRQSETEATGEKTDARNYSDGAETPTDGD